MDVIFSHITALEVLRRWDSFKLIGSSSNNGARHIPRSAPGADELSDIVQLPVLAGTTLPLHVLVEDKNRRLYNEKVFSHAVLSAYPEGSFFSVAPGVLCSSPELVALQMTEYATDLELLLLVDELCSHYAIQPHAKTGLVQRGTPLTTLRKIEKYLEDTGMVRGASRLRRTLDIARERSGSPPESKTCHQFELCLAKGGYSLEVVALNDPIEVERARTVLKDASPRIRKPDILLLAPGGTSHAIAGTRTGFHAVAVDYQGGYHRDPGQAVRDIDRRNELLACNVKDYEIAKEHFADIGYLDWLVTRIRRDLGIAEPKLTPQAAADYQKRRAELNEELRAIDGLHWTARSKRLVMAGAPDFFGATIPHGERGSRNPLRLYSDVAISGEMTSDIAISETSNSGFGHISK